MMINVRTGILTPAILMARRLSSFWRMPRRETVLRMPYPRGSLIDVCLMGMILPIR